MLRQTLLLLTAAVVIALGFSAATASECGKASWYDKSAGAHGGLAAAHPSLPFGTLVVVENLDNGRRASMTIKDRRAFYRGQDHRCTREAAEKLDFIEAGIARVRISSGGRRVSEVLPIKTGPSSHYDLGSRRSRYPQAMVSAFLLATILAVLPTARGDLEDRASETLYIAVQRTVSFGNSSDQVTVEHIDPTRHTLQS